MPPCRAAPRTPSSRNRRRFREGPARVYAPRRVKSRVKSRVPGENECRGRSRAILRVDHVSIIFSLRSQFRRRGGSGERIVDQLHAPSSLGWGGNECPSQYLERWNVNCVLITPSLYLASERVKVPRVMDIWSSWDAWSGAGTRRPELRWRRIGW